MRRSVTARSQRKAFAIEEETCTLSYVWLYLRKESPSEDALTGALADILSWSGSTELLGALLASTWAFDETRTRQGSAFNLPPWTRFEIEPWPRWEAGEPDAVVRLMDGDALRAIIVFEAKLGAPKSGVDEADRDDGRVPAPNEGDQLARYFAHAAKPGFSTTIVYLTHHLLPPEEELRFSFAAMRRRVECARPEQLRWLSWRHVEKLLREATVPTHEVSFKRCVESVAGVLRSVGFHSFRGHWAELVSVLQPQPPKIWWQVGPPRAYRWSEVDSFSRAPSRFYKSKSTYAWGVLRDRALDAVVGNVVFWRG